MATFMTLFGKEMRRRQASLGTSCVFNLAIIGVAYASFVLLSWHPSWPPQAVISVLSWFIIIAPFMVFAVSLEAWSYEWEGDHQHQLLSLPLSGRMILGAKTAAVVFDILTFLVSVKILLLLLARMDPAVLPVFHPDGTMMAGGALSSLLGFTTLIALMTLAVALLFQFAWVAGAAVRGLQFYVGAAVALVGAWLMLRAAALADQVLAWFPHVTWWWVGGAVSSYRDGEGSTVFDLSTEPVIISLSTAPLVAMVLVGGMLYLVAAHLLEEQVEV